MLKRLLLGPLLEMGGEIEQILEDLPRCLIETINGEGQRPWLEVGVGPETDGIVRMMARGSVSGKLKTRDQIMLSGGATFVVVRVSCDGDVCIIDAERSSREPIGENRVGLP